MDGGGRPASSMLKALEMLIESYQVYIVCSAPTNRHAYLSEKQIWVEQYVSTLAHDHVVFTNRRDMLLGDYLVDLAPAKDFMGARLAFGSDEFKTWEDVIVYFERLGGQ